MHSAQQLRNFAGMSEGIEYRVRSAAEQARSLEELILSIKSKRYTYARISRMLMSVFIGLTAEETALANEAPPYVRVLGVRKESKSCFRCFANVRRFRWLPACRIFFKRFPKACFSGSFMQQISVRRSVCRRRMLRG